MWTFGVKAERLKKPLVAAFLEALRSEVFKKELITGYPGLIPTERLERKSLTLNLPVNLRTQILFLEYWALTMSLYIEMIVTDSQ